MKEEKMKQAVALTYRPHEQSAPTVIAKGKGKVAENLIATAKEHSIPIQKDPSLVELLSELEINEAIPEQLYQVVAELFAFVYQMDRQLDAHD
ncbi:flhB HrpN YscU SpaS family protein [Anoxybacillus sp. B7M1]|jgi:flagellar biosynthesis protein|uniref:EscU/YscU/HrcU family type III secretion system export apparatus switch protein n=1 Tax=Anoxybacteroides rupiense TaxID=311460 RepID=A0ABD5IR64_9BACL|nr:MULTISPECIES: EscU/YscU/HrcU family type III secretion system export apparatus switch protein [Anoxybacillus]ANB56501.1 flhB HrpN YscU SpaS family protein [Anoxybacillus sp. B2M1]ANB64882.1 flhB HrpN YscU SpaS family protein [Anoxybacillus sp. B7M1]KXG10533.1 Flagellar biosynthetic protein FlhB [Anoxybacillus sp. P3H1B]MBB3906183.1 flagellar biosynthesis protein [Anoxybacillus rupiensis]MBS2770992.1 EscU/YscU/HrcU family type III secretion system export apparatus switch protein [Anoxybacill